MKNGDRINVEHFCCIASSIKLDVLHVKSKKEKRKLTIKELHAKRFKLSPQK
jgi:hypothetical protein